METFTWLSKEFGGIPEKFLCKSMKIRLKDGTLATIVSNRKVANGMTITITGHILGRKLFPDTGNTYLEEFQSAEIYPGMWLVIVRNV